MRTRRPGFEEAIREFHGIEGEVVDVTPAPRPRRPIVSFEIGGRRDPLAFLRDKSPRWEKMFKVWLYAVLGLVSVAAAYFAVVILV